MNVCTQPVEWNCLVMSEETDDAVIETLPIEMATSSPKNRRSESMTSRFYEADAVDQKVQSFIENTSANIKQKNPNDKIKQSRHLPLWAWYIIAKCHGIPLKPGSRPIFGTLLHALTFAGAIIYAMSYSWYVVYDIISPNTPRDIPGGSVSMLLVYFWCGFGYYCKDLSSRLFLHHRFLKDIRMHTRTVFKMNGAILVSILGFFFTAANVVESLDWFSKVYCDKIELDPLVCHVMSISSIVFSIFTFIWHSLVSFVFMSVCRTHTIGLRRFIKEIEYDASIVEHHLSFTYKISPINQDDIWQESLWIAEEENDDEYTSYLPRARQHTISVSKKDLNPCTRSPEHSIRQQDPRQREISVLFSPVVEVIENSRHNSTEFEWNHNNDDKDFIPVRQLLEAHKDVPVDSAATPHTMTNAEILHHFWKLNCRLRFSSYTLQRWYATFVSLVLLRCSTYLVHWLGHPALVFDILQFVLPLVLLIVLSTAIAEVNFEGQRVLRCIYPIETRIKTLQYMALNPLQMSVYGFGMTHGTIVTVVFAILAGFVSKIVITEISKAQ